MRVLSISISNYLFLVKNVTLPLDQNFTMAIVLFSLVFHLYFHFSFSVFIWFLFFIYLFLKHFQTKFGILIDFGMSHLTGDKIPQK